MATTLTLQHGLNGYAGGEDALIISAVADRDKNYGAFTNILGGYHTEGYIYRNLIKFNDLTGIPANVIITSATLKLYCVYAENNDPEDMGVYRVLQNWVEGTANGVAQAGSSSWNSYQHGTATWNTAGADAASDAGVADDVHDRFATATDKVTVTVAGGVWHEWNVLSDVQAWYGSWANYGWVLLCDQEAAESRKGWRVKDAGSPYETTRPILEIIYNLFPSVTSVTANSGPDTGGTSVTIAGTDFQDTPTVTFGGVSATSIVFVSATELTCNTPAGTPGAVDVVVTNPDTGTDTLVGGFTYISTPTVTSVTANSGPDTGGTSVTVAGSDFVDGATITFGGSSATGVVFVNSTEVTCNTPAHTAGVVDVVLTNPDTGTDTLVGGFTYEATAPTIISISPTRGETTGNINAVITGTNFTADSYSVTFGSVVVTSVTIVSSTSLSCTVPGQSQGTVDIIVTNDSDQSDTLPGGFVYYAVPAPKKEKKYYRSTKTRGLTHNLPKWFKMRKDDSLNSSRGWHFLNAAAGIEFDTIEDTLKETRDNQYVKTAYVNEPDIIYKSEHEEDIEDLKDELSIEASGTLIDASGAALDTLVDINKVDTLELFFENYPTRLVELGIIYPSGLLGNEIKGLVYAEHFYREDDYGTQDDTGLSGVFIIQAETSGANTSGGIIYPSGLANPYVDYHAFLRKTQAYDYLNGVEDELLIPASGADQVWRAELGHYPVDETVELLDYMHLDASGAATVEPAANYTVNHEHKTVTFNVTASSHYISEYDYLLGLSGWYLTTDANFWNVQEYNGDPVMTTVPVGYSGNYLPFEFAQSAAPSDGKLLRVNPILLRPEATATVELDFNSYTEAEWNPASGDFEYIASSLPYFVGTHENMIQVYDGNDLVDWVFEPNLDAMESGNVSIPSSQASGNMYDDHTNDSLTVRINYYGTKHYSITAESSMASEYGQTNPYPLDYILKKEKDPTTLRTVTALYPFTMLKVRELSNTSIQSSLADATQDQLRVRTDYQYAGITYDKDRAAYWIVEKNNQRLVLQDAADNNIISEYNIFRPDPVTDAAYKAAIQPSGVTGVYYTYRPQDLLGHDLRGIVYLDGLLWICDATDQCLYLIDTTDERRMDIDLRYEWGRFYLPSGVLDPEDMALDKDENILVADGDHVHQLDVLYDYFIPDYKNRMIYYREYYTYTDADAAVLPFIWDTPGHGFDEGYWM